MDNGVRQALEAVDRIPVTEVENQTKLLKEPDGTKYTYNWNPKEMTGSFGDQIEKIEAMLPQGVSKAQDLTRNFCIKQFKELACIGIIVENPEDIVDLENKENAEIYLNQVKSIVEMIFINGVKNTIQDAASELSKRIDEIDDKEVIATEEAIENIPNDTSNYTFEKLKSAMINYSEIAKDFVIEDESKAIAIKIGLKDQINSIKDFLLIEDTSLPASIFFGSILTESSRLSVNHILVNANDTLTKVIARLKVQQKDLSRATETMVQEQYRAIAADYFSTDYSTAITKITKLLRQERLASLSFFLSERVISEVLRSLCNLPNTD